MADRSPDEYKHNGYDDRPSPAQLASGTVEVRVAKPAPTTGSRRTKRTRPTSSPPTVSLIIPVRNEARTIACFLEQIADEVSEIILVDGNSTDATLITACSARPDIKVISQEGVGKGSALRTGFLAASSDVIVVMDANGSMAPQEIRHYLHFLTNGYDFVKGSRFIVGGGSLDGSHSGRLGNRFVLTVFNTLYDTKLTDLSYGFCAFHRRYLDLLSLRATGLEIEAEMAVRAVQVGLRVVEVPSLEMSRRSGKSNLHAIRNGIRVLRTVVRSHHSEVFGPVMPPPPKSTGAQQLARTSPR